MVPALAQLLLAAHLTLGADTSAKLEIPAAPAQKAAVVRTVEPLSGSLAKLAMNNACCGNPSCTCDGHCK